MATERDQINHQYYLKDKKLSIWEYTTIYVSGVSKKQYVKKYDKIWTYYRHGGGNASYKNSNGILIYDDDAAAIFVTNKRPINIGWTLVYNHKIYEITRIDDFEGYKEDIKILAKLATSQSFANGLVDD